MSGAEATKRALTATPVAELTRAVLGSEMSLSQAMAFLQSDWWEEATAADDQQPEIDDVWAGSIGYEDYREVDDFVAALHDSGIQLVVDVRELPISRRRGYAKTALGEALASQGIEYLHLRSLGNPKEIRTLWKSGAVEAGRTLYRDHLLTSERTALEELPELLRAKRCALMCFEHDEDVCHRQVIFECLRDEIGLRLETERLPLQSVAAPS